MAKGIPTKISAVSRISIKIKDNFYTLEASEERQLPEGELNMEEEFTALFNEINDMIDKQAEEVKQTFK